MNRGLLPIKRKDHRTYDFNRTFGSAFGTPEEFNFDKSGVMPDQNRDGNYNACTAYANNDIATSDDSVPNYDDYRYIYEKTLFMSGADKDVPVEHMKALKAATVYGVKHKSESEADALNHRRGQYFLVKKNPDYFEGLISAMWVKQGGLSIGSPWPARIQMTGADGIVPMFLTPPTFVTGHCWSAVGVKKINGEQRIICKSWQGPNFGDKGYCYFSRDQVNKLLGVSGAGAFVQKKADPREIQYVKMTITETISSYIAMWIEKLRKQLLETSVPVSAPIVVPEPAQPQPAPVEPEMPKYDWDTPTLARHSVRVICDEEGLNVREKDIICAVIQGESGFNPKAVNKNNDGTADYGICQLNSYWYIGKGKPVASIEEALNNPEKCVRAMIKSYRAGRLGDWIAFRSGAYKKFL